MKLKYTPGDFRVREMLRAGVVRTSGRHRVYRVTKIKLTTLEAARALSDAVGVPVAQVGLAGLKDRQGVTTQYMSVPTRRGVHIQTPELRVHPVGYASQPLTSHASTGNAFTITVRDVARETSRTVGEVVDLAREQGIPNYFGSQRFGNLRYHQGWVALDLVHGRHERALQALLSRASDHDDERNTNFKSALEARWGDWRACRDIAGKFGAHHSIFEHLRRRPDDFAGAFAYVASRLRLIHLYAWQSHVWNRAVARYIEELAPARERVELSFPEGRLFYARGPIEIDPSMQNRFRLPGPRLEDVSHPTQRRLLTEVLKIEGLRPEQFDIRGVSGFQLKGEDRELVIRPRALRIERGFGTARDSASTVRVHFELPRGAYANLVVERLFAGEREIARSNEKPRAPRDGKKSRGSRDRGVARGRREGEPERASRDRDQASSASDRDKASSASDRDKASSASDRDTKRGSRGRDEERSSRYREKPRGSVDRAPARGAARSSRSRENLEPRARPRRSDAAPDRAARETKPRKGKGKR